MRVRYPMSTTRNGPTITERLQAIEMAHDEEKQELVRQFWENYANQSHDIESIPDNNTHSNVTFFYIGAEKYICSDFCGLLKDEDKNFKLKNIPGTDIYYLTKPLPNDLRAEYVFHDGNLDKAPWNDRRVLAMPNVPPQPYVPNPQKIAPTEQKQLMLFKPTLIAKQLAEIENEKKKLQNEKKELLPEKIKLARERFRESDPQIVQSITEKIMELERKIASIENREKRLDIKKIEINANKDKFPTSSIELGQLQLEKMKAEKRFIELDINVEGGPYQGERKCWVHLPKDYDPKREPPYPLSILLDGGQYHTSIPTPSIMDNMIEKGDIPPTVTVLISNAGEVKRFSEYNCNADFTNFIADFVKELPNRLPTFQDKDGTNGALRVSNHPQDISIGGSSAGGLAAVYAGLTRPDVFGNVISLSSAIWMEHKEGRSKNAITTAIDKFSKEYKKSSWFYIAVGTEENNQIIKNKETNDRYPSMLKTNQDMRGQMKNNGIQQVSYHEFTGGHNDICWQGLISEALIQMHNPANIFTKTEDKTTNVQPVSSTTRIADELHITPSTLSPSSQQREDKSEVKKLDATKKEIPAHQPLSESSAPESHQMTPFSTTPKPGRK